MNGGVTRTDKDIMETVETVVFADRIVKRFLDGTAQAIPIAPRAARENQAISTEDAGPHHRSQGGRVVLFLPEPVTEDDLLIDAVARARSVRRHRARRRSILWLEENFGTLVFVTGLLVLAWLVAAK